MNAAAEAREYEQAALERNRLRAVRSLLERQRVANDAVGSVDAIAVAVDGSDANAQVFQVRDGVLADRQSFYLQNAGELGSPTSRSSSSLQYYSTPRHPAADHRPGRARRGRARSAAALSERRGARRRGARRRARRQAPDPRARRAQRKLALDQERLKAERRRQQRVEALDELQSALGLDALPLRIECFDISNLMGTHTVASMAVFEGGAPKKSDYRRFNVRSLEDGVPDDFAAMREVLTRRLGMGEPA